MFKTKHVLMGDEGGDGGNAGGGAGDGGAGAAPAADGQSAAADGAPASAAPAAAAAPANAKGAAPAVAHKAKPDGGDGGANPDGEAKGYWPDDWVTRVSKGDEKLAKQLGRYASPEAMAEALVAAQAKIRSGELKAALPKNAKPEELAQWRKDNGIPDKPEDYDLKFDSGLVIGDEDKTIIDAFLKTAHAKNMAPDQVKASVEWYYEEQKRQTESRLAKDDEQRVATLDALNAEWGNNFRRHVNMIDGLLAKMPESVRDSFKGARLADGTAVFNHPDILRGFAALALELDPAGTLTPAGNGDPSKNVDAEIAEIEAFMRSNRMAYNKDEKKQARYRDLLGAREKLQKRAA